MARVVLCQGGNDLPRSESQLDTNKLTDSAAQEVTNYSTQFRKRHVPSSVSDTKQR
jgi:hypothetical protein